MEIKVSGRLAFAFFTLFAICFNSYGASFTDVDLKRFGSTEPQGDVLTIRFMADQEDRQLRLEVRAIVLKQVDVAPEPNGAKTQQVSTPKYLKSHIKAVQQSFRDPSNGDFILKKDVSRLPFVA